MPRKSDYRRGPRVGRLRLGPGARTGVVGEDVNQRQVFRTKGNKKGRDKSHDLPLRSIGLLLSSCPTNWSIQPRTHESTFDRHTDVFGQKSHGNETTQRRTDNRPGNRETGLGNPRPPLGHRAICTPDVRPRQPSTEISHAVANPRISE